MITLTLWRNLSSLNGYCMWASAHLSLPGPFDCVLTPFHVLTQVFRYTKKALGGQKKKISFSVSFFSVISFMLKKPLCIQVDFAHLSSLLLPTCKPPVLSPFPTDPDKQPCTGHSNTSLLGIIQLTNSAKNEGIKIIINKTDNFLLA